MSKRKEALAAKANKMRAVVLVLDNNEVAKIPKLSCQFLFKTVDNSIQKGKIIISDIDKIEIISPYIYNSVERLIEFNDVRGIKVTKKIDCFSRPIQEYKVDPNISQSIYLDGDKLIIEWGLEEE